MKPEDPQSWLATARRFAEQAAAEIMRLKDQEIAKHRKADQSIVTEADLRADKIIREGLQQTFPEHGLITEESGLLESAQNEYVWLIDPLDGTKAYAKNKPGFAVMIGLLKQGQPYLGVVVDPMEHRTYDAIRGHGAFVTDRHGTKALKVSERADYTEMRLVVSTGFPEMELARIREDLSGPLLDPINSVGIKVGRLVRQEADIYINHHSVHLWDTCAPQIILEEAGGCFTKLDGSPLKYELKAPFSHNSLSLATNGQRHEDIVALLQAKKMFHG